MRRIILFLQVGVGAVFQNKLRSCLSVSGVVCGVLAVMIMIATGEGAKKEVLKELEGLGLHNIYIKSATEDNSLNNNESIDSASGLSWYDIHRLESHGTTFSHITAVKNIHLEISGVADNISPQILRTTGSYKDIAGVTVERGRFLTGADNQFTSLVCVLGAGIAKELGAQGVVGSKIQIGSQLYEVVGVLRDKKILGDDVGSAMNTNSNDMVFLPFPSYMTMSNHGQNSTPAERLDQIIVQVHSQIDVLEAAKIVERQLFLNQGSSQGFQVIVPLELLTQSLKTQRTLNVFLLIIGSISLFVGGIGIMNVMLANVSERKQEIGIRRAVGASEKDIGLQFLLESCILTSAGGGLGVVVGIVSIFMVELLAGWPIKITLITVLAPLVLSAVTGVFFGLYPAQQAAKLNPIESLRSV